MVTREYGARNAPATGEYDSDIPQGWVALALRGHAMFRRRLLSSLILRPQHCLVSLSSLSNGQCVSGR